MGTGSFLGVKRPGLDADHTPPSSAEVTKGYSYTSIHFLGLFRPVMGLLDLYLQLEPSTVIELIVIEGIAGNAAESAHPFWKLQTHLYKFDVHVTVHRRIRQDK
jgi:hypothetical protein